MKPSGVITTPSRAPRPRRDAQVGDRRAELLGDARDDARVGVERFGVGWAGRRARRAERVLSVTC